MTAVRVHKAQPICSEDPIPSLAIVAAETLPSFENLDAQREFCDAEAGAIVQALRDTLPGATFDAIVVKLLETRTSQLRVRHDTEPKRTQSAKLDHECSPPQIALEDVKNFKSARWVPEKGCRRLAVEEASMWRCECEAWFLLREENGNRFWQPYDPQKPSP